jgi:catechol 2,3-dioxygenase-like lactoylglutathione lyase family enzyme
VPHAERGERFNAGVVLFARTRDFLGARVALDRRRLSALAPSADADALERQLDGLARIAAGDPDAGPIARLDRPARFHWLVAPASTVIRPSPVHAGTCPDPAEALDKLFDRLVAPEGDPAVRRAVPNIRSDRPADTRDFFVELLGFEVAMDLGWVATVSAPANRAVQVNIIGSDDPAAPGISVEVADVDAAHARALELGHEIVYALRDEPWGVRRFMLREPSGTLVNVVSHRPG